MKKITLLFLFISFSALSQSNGDFNGRTRFILKYLTTQSLYTTAKINALRLNDENAVIKMTDEQKGKLPVMFDRQYGELTTAFANHKEKNNAASKLAMIKVLVQHEDEFRALLTEEQKIYYSTYDNSKVSNRSPDFPFLFMSDKELMGWKKELL